MSKKSNKNIIENDVVNDENIDNIENAEIEKAESEIESVQAQSIEAEPVKELAKETIEFKAGKNESFIKNLRTEKIHKVPTSQLKTYLEKPKNYNEAKSGEFVAKYELVSSGANTINVLKSQFLYGKPNGTKSGCKSCGS